MTKKVKKTKLKTPKIGKFFKKIYDTLDKIIITPISRLIFLISDKLKNNPSTIERILNRPHVLLYLSLVFAICMFFLIDKEVINLVNNEAEIIANQPVKVLYNSEAYVVEGLVDTVDIILTGNKSAIYLAKQLGGHEVVLDLTDYKPSDTPYRVKLTYNQSVDSIDYKLDPTYVTVTIKNKVSKLATISTELLNETKLDSKLSVENVELSRNEVVVKGSEEALNKIATVKALIDLSSEEYKDAGIYETDNIPLVAYDEKGNLLNNIEIVPATVSATITLDTYKKTVPIRVTTTGNLVTGKAISAVSINGASSYTVDIYGEKEVIDKIESVPVTIDLSIYKGSASTQEYNVTIVKPNGVRYISKTSAKIVISLGEEKQKTITVKSIEPKNLADHLNVNFTSDSGEISVQVKGVQSVIDTITENNISAYIDLAGYNTAGDYEADVKIESNDPRITFVVSNKAKIKIVEK